MSSHPQPLEFDPELGKILPTLPIPTVLAVEMLPTMRAGTAKTTTAESVIAGNPISHRELDIDGPHGSIKLSIFENTEAGSTKKARPGIFHIHGGGRILGNRFSGMANVVQWITKFEAVCVSIEYRLAPEHQGIVAVDECYTGLRWMGDNVDQLGIDPSKLMIAGQSAGGGLAAGVALLVRDKGGPALCAQLLMCPMLDDRNNTVSSRQFAEKGIWSAQANEVGWSCVLGEHHGTSEVSIYLAPARARDLTGLPPAYIDVGSAEVFRDEDVAYALKLWECGVQTELHVWPGGFHVFDIMAPTTAVSRKAIKTRTEWVEKILA